MTPGTSKPSSSSFAGDFAPGEILIGRYRVIALVGEGGMGQVYLADDLVLGQPVALKFLPTHLAEREGGLERFRAEVRHAREVTHPNVARVHDIGEVHGRHFLTMEYVDGEDLASLIKRIGRLPREKAAEIAQQICAGIAEAHERGVLHRDLKPANVMLDGDGRVMRALVRRPWLGNGLWMVLLVGLMSWGEFEVIQILAPVVVLGVFLTLLTRFGFLAVVAFMFMLFSGSALIPTLLPGDPAFGSSVFTLLVFVGLVTWACRTAVGARSAVA